MNKNTNMNKQENNTNSKTMQKSNRKNKAWMRNPDQLKTPKFFSAVFMRNKDGSFHMMGGQSKYLNRSNDTTASWTKVDTRDLCVELRQNTIRSF